MNPQQSQYRQMDVILNGQPIQVQEISRVSTCGVDFSVYVQMSTCRVFVLTNHLWFAAVEASSLFSGLKHCMELATAAHQNSKLDLSLEFFTSQVWAHLLPKFQEAGMLSILPIPTVISILIPTWMIPALISNDLDIVDIHFGRGESH